MSDDEAGWWNGTEDYVQRLQWTKSKRDRSCFCVLFASDAEAGTWIADGNGVPFIRAAILHK